MDQDERENEGIFDDWEEAAADESDPILEQSIDNKIRLQNSHHLNNTASSPDLGLLGRNISKLTIEADSVDGAKPIKILQRPPRGGCVIERRPLDNDNPPSFTAACSGSSIIDESKEQNLEKPPKMAILKPSAKPGGASGVHHHRSLSATTPLATSHKSFEQRQAEYNEARLRILGAVGDPTENDDPEVSVVPVDGLSNNILTASESKGHGDTIVSNAAVTSSSTSTHQTQPALVNMAPTNAPSLPVNNATSIYRFSPNPVKKNTKQKKQKNNKTQYQQQQQQHGGGAQSTSAGYVRQHTQQQQQQQQQQNLIRPGLGRGTTLPPPGFYHNPVMPSYGMPPQYPPNNYQFHVPPPPPPPRNPGNLQSVPTNRPGVIVRTSQPPPTTWNNMRVPPPSLVQQNRMHFAPPGHASQNVNPMSVQGYNSSEMMRYNGYY